MRAVTSAGRLAWGVSGLLTVAALAAGIVPLIASAGARTDQLSASPPGMRTVTAVVQGRVTSLTVESYGAPVTVTGAPVPRVIVTETADFGASRPHVDESVQGGHLIVGGAVCGTSENCVGFAVTVPLSVAVAVTSDGGPVTVSGTAATNVDSGGAQVNILRIDGPLIVTSAGGPARLADVTAPVQADTGGGALYAERIAAATATITTSGGPLQLGGRIGRLAASTGGGRADVVLSAAPGQVTLFTDGGPATLTVPAGTYAVTASSDGGPQSVAIPSTPGATRSITVRTGGGLLEIEPGS